MIQIIIKHALKKIKYCFYQFDTSILASRSSKLSLANKEILEGQSFELDDTSAYHRFLRKLVTAVAPTGFTFLFSLNFAPFNYFILNKIEQ